MISKKEFYESKIEDCQKAVWWNELILEIQKENKSDTDATEEVIKRDKATIERLQNEIRKIDNE